MTDNSINRAYPAYRQRILHKTDAWELGGLNEEEAVKKIRSFFSEAREHKVWGKDVANLKLDVDIDNIITVGGLSPETETERRTRIDGMSRKEAAEYANYKRLKAKFEPSESPVD